MPGNHLQVVLHCTLLHDTLSCLVVCFLFLVDEVSHPHCDRSDERFENFTVLLCIRDNPDLSRWPIPSPCIVSSTSFILSASERYGQLPSLAKKDPDRFDSCEVKEWFVFVFETWHHLLVRIRALAVAFLIRWIVFRKAQVCSQVGKVPGRKELNIPLTRNCRPIYRISVPVIIIKTPEICSERVN